jgi:mRNA interferase HigB
VRIISRKALREFWQKHADAERPLRAWYQDVKHSDWEGPADIKNTYQNCSFVSNNRVVFNIKGNKYRIVVMVQYTFRIVFIRFVGTHKEYDRINPAMV